MRRVAIVLHTHLPYVRRNGTWPCGEDFFHQAATESYLPLLGVLSRLCDRGVRNAVTVGITPLLAHQMSDEHMLRELQWYLGRYECRAIRQVANWRWGHEREIRSLAAHYSVFAREQLARLGEATTIAAAFRALEESGVVEIMGGPASHPLLPMISEPALVDLQLRVGLDQHARIFGRRPDAMWLPECAAAPGIEEPLARAGVRRVVVDATALGSLQPASCGGLVAIPRDVATANHVWSAGGYPENEWYRDFHNYDMEAGFKNFRITGPNVAVLSKKLYEPSRAQAQAAEDADRFVRALASLPQDPIVVAFDTELFGHWWFEGPAWLESVLIHLARDPSIEPITLSQIDAQSSVSSLASSTWGVGSDFRSWITPQTEDLWRRLRVAEAETVALLKDHSGPGADQLLRELLLLQSSDWPYLIVKGESADYARDRFETHHERWSALASVLRSDTDPGALTEHLYDIDNPFPSLPGSLLR